MVNTVFHLGPEHTASRAISFFPLRRKRARAYSCSRHEEVLRWRRIRWSCESGCFGIAMRV